MKILIVEDELSLQKSMSSYLQREGNICESAMDFQTPLSVIQNNIELLLQDESLNEKQHAIIQAVYEAAGRLSRLNKALLLLSKIENPQYKHSSELSISKLLNRLLAEYSELARTHGIKIDEQMDPNVAVALNTELAEVMFRNLLSNAIKHHKGSDPIQLTLNENTFIISNPGQKPDVSPEEMFNRFQKNTHDFDSLGLGLSIVKAIAETANFGISYNFASGMHTIRISFHKEG